jgi:hypothetical protein
LWLYYEYQLKLSLTELDEISHQRLIKRIYAHILSIGGNILAFIGFWSSISWLIDTMFDVVPEYGSVYDKLNTGIALLIIGLPLWIIHWRKLQIETAMPDKTGLIARKATLRRFYLYFFVFGSVIGIMGTAGSFFYNLLFIILGRDEPELGHFIISSLFFILIFVVWLIYHRKIMRNDNAILESSIKTENEAISVLLITTESDEPIMENISKSIISKYEYAKTNLIQLTDEFMIPDFDEYQTIIISMQTIITYPDTIAVLEKSDRKVLLIPIQTDNLIPVADTSMSEITRNVINALNQIKNGSEIKIHSKKSALHIVAYVIGGFIALNLLWQLLMGILTVVSN